MSNHGSRAHDHAMPDRSLALPACVIVGMEEEDIEGIRGPTKNRIAANDHAVFTISYDVNSEIRLMEEAAIAARQGKLEKGKTATDHEKRAHACA